MVGKGTSDSARIRSTSASALAVRRRSTSVLFLIWRPQDVEVRKSSWLRKIWRLQWISPWFKRRACLSSSSRNSLTVAYRRLKSDTIDFLLSKWHDSPASSLCLAEIARRAAMSMLFACSSAYNTKEGMWHETGRPQEVCTEYYSDFVSCVFPCNFTNPESP